MESNDTLSASDSLGCNTQTGQRARSSDSLVPSDSLAMNKLKTHPGPEDLFSLSLQNCCCRLLSSSSHHSFSRRCTCRRRSNLCCLHRSPDSTACCQPTNAQPTFNCHRSSLSSSSHRRPACCPAIFHLPSPTVALLIPVSTLPS